MASARFPKNLHNVTPLPVIPGALLGTRAWRKLVKLPFHAEGTEGISPLHSAIVGRRRISTRAAQTGQLFCNLLALGSCLPEFAHICFADGFLPATAARTNGDKLEFGLALALLNVPDRVGGFFSPACANATRTAENIVTLVEKEKVLALAGVVGTDIVSLAMSYEGERARGLFP